MKIALLYICTGRYNQLFRKFYESSEKYFLPSADKTYFVWTDDTHLADGLSSVCIYFKECAGFPFDSLFRFEMFMQAEDVLKEYDYIYFFNANAEFRHEVGHEILPDESGLAIGRWPGVEMHRPAMFLGFERNKKSLAYVAPYNPPYIYYMGGLNGGTSEAYLKMIRTLSTNIRLDYERGIIACAHDQSHINAYLRTHKCKVLGVELTWPEEWYFGPPLLKKGDCPRFDKGEIVEPLIVFREKTHLDSYFNKGRKKGKLVKLKKGINRVFSAIKWYLFIN